MKTSTFAFLLAALSTIACTSGDPSGAKYFVVGNGQTTVPQGTNCGGFPTTACTIGGGQGFPNCSETSTEDGQSTWAIYPGASGGAYLIGAISNSSVLGSGTPVLVGSQSGNGYNFAAKTIVLNTNTSPSTTDEVDITVAVTLSGSGFTGTLTTDTIHTDPDTSYNCTVTSQVLGAELNAEEVELLNPVPG